VVGLVSFTALGGATSLSGGVPVAAATGVVSAGSKGSTRLLEDIRVICRLEKERFCLFAGVSGVVVVEKTKESFSSLLFCLV